jgi:hypothetical protein
LIETALHQSYSRWADHRNTNIKAFVEPSEALWRQNKDLILTNLDLKEEVLYFINDAKFDEERARKYLQLPDTKELYGAVELSKPKDAKDHEERQFLDHIHSTITKDIKEFRTYLIAMVRPTGDALTGYSITKSQDELFGILNETRLYQSGKYIDDRARYFARFFFNGLTDKSQQIVLDKLIEDELNENQPEKEQNQSQSKKSGKNRRRRKNKNKNDTSANNKDGKIPQKKGKNQGKGNKPKTYNMQDEEEKK